MTDKPELTDVIQFLLGEGTLDGVNYGERPAAQPTFWWRKALREAWNTRATPYPVTKEEAVELKQQIEKMASVTMSANPINNSELSLKVTLRQFAKLRRLLEAAAQQGE